MCDSSRHWAKPSDGSLHCAVPYSEWSRLLVVHVICTILSRATLSKNIIRVGPWALSVDIYMPSVACLPVRRAWLPCILAYLRLFQCSSTNIVNTNRGVWGGSQLPQ